VGEGVGYGGRWRATRPSRVAILPVGYADGYLRGAQPGAEALLRGRRVPLAGVISMDALAIDVTDVPDGGGRRGDFATLIGEGISVDDVASHKAFSEKHGLPFPILADSEKATATAYGTLTTYKDMVLSQRDTFIIDPEGRIAKHYVQVDPKGHSEAVLADLKQLANAAVPKG